LEEINPLEGFPSRTFERVASRLAMWTGGIPPADGIWDWKAHTSSDEIIAHTFGSSALYETTAKTTAEKQRIATFMAKVADHIIRHHWQLIDMDGKPTYGAVESGIRERLSEIGFRPAPEQRGNHRHLQFVTRSPERISIKKRRTNFSISTAISKISDTDVDLAPTDGQIHLGSPRQRLESLR
jgi:hypothetical protein